MANQKTFNFNNFKIVQYSKVSNGRNEVYACQVMFDDPAIQDIPDRFFFTPKNVSGKASKAYLFKLAKQYAQNIISFSNFVSESIRLNRDLADATGDMPNVKLKHSLNKTGVVGVYVKKHGSSPVGYTTQVTKNGKRSFKSFYFNKFQGDKTRAFKAAVYHRLNEICTPGQLEQQ
jgi:hypothetical protein